MSFTNALPRLIAYRRRHGLRATLKRATTELRRTLFASWRAVNCCDLLDLRGMPAKLPAGLQVQRKRNAAEIAAQDLAEILKHGIPAIIRRRMEARFEAGAVLWLIKSGNRLAGYRWSLQGRTMEPFFFPLTPKDVHLFDLLIFPEYRRQGLNQRSLQYVLSRLAEEGAERAFSDVAEWNRAQLASLRDTPLRPFGWARRFAFLRYNLVLWNTRRPLDAAAQVAGSQTELAERLVS
ncbi:MAG TPA: GNAT family N-acetyltransferase [Terriglobia bacterium]|nr:GNAT family N-acetyltransferase [Terriglobia bacterium]